MTVLDLTHPIAPDMPVYPGDPQPRLTPLAFLPEDGFRQLGMTLTTHTGTHVDAPAHLLERGDVVKIPLMPTCSSCSSGCANDGKPVFGFRRTMRRG